MSEPAQKTVPLYRCRNCDDRFTGTAIDMPSRDAAFQMVAFGRVVDHDSNSWRERARHDCPDGTQGVGDCIGFRDLKEGA